MSVNKELCKTFNQSSIKEHSKKKSMWLGCATKTDNTEYIFEDGTITYRSIAYPPSLYKIYDEIMVNIVDIFVKSRESKVKVTKAGVSFTRDGKIVIYNNGNGIPIDIVEDLEGKPIYIPSLVSTKFLTGSNNSDDEDRITGGINGLGMTLVNAQSNYYLLETVDLVSGKYFKQLSEKQLDIVHKPVVKKRSAAKGLPIARGGTSVTFIPNYKTNKINIADDYDELNLLFRTRVMQISAHLGLAITYTCSSESEPDSDEPGSTQSEVIKLDMKTFAGYCADSTIHAVLPGKYPWSLSVGIPKTLAYEQISIINGVHVKSGTHLDYIRDSIVDGIKVRVQKFVSKYKTYNKSMITSNLFIAISGNIPNISFNGQTKDSITENKKKYAEYKVPAAMLTKILNMLKPLLTEQYIAVTAPTKKKTVSTSGIKKYTPATKCSIKRHQAKCMILICEGDSAESMCRTALTNKKVARSYEFTGTFNIGGVPMNVRTKSTVVESKGKSIVVSTKKANDNERWSSLHKVLNLDHNCTYETKEERATLRYGSVIVTVDQDLDGVGQINGLILAHFDLHWPALLKAGYIKQLMTPIMRAYPKNKSAKKTILSFYTDHEYMKWKSENFGSGEPVGWNIKYYKGLATHNDREAIDIFKKFDDSLLTLRYDSKAKRMFEVYYGKAAALRRAELSTPVIPIARITTCTQQLQTNTKDYQLDNISRKLPNVIDGLNPSRRKVLAACIKRAKSSNAETKVCNLAGYVSETMNYHHGGASLESTIVSMAQELIGTNNTPLILPLGQYGSRHKSGKDAGASRYVKTQLNVELVSALFPRADDDILTYTFDEGIMNEPVHYIPVLPFLLMKSLAIPGTGWRYMGYARDIDAIIANVQRMLTGNKPITMPFWKNGWRGTIGSVGTHTNSTYKEYFLGTYTMSKLVVTVTEIPFHVGVESYLKSIEVLSLVDNIVNNSDNKNINIVVTLKATPPISKTSTVGDNIQNYLKLTSRKCKEINVCDVGILKNTNSSSTGVAVVECDDYIDVLTRWYKVRMETYVLRFERQIILILLQIKFIDNITRFVKENKYNFAKHTLESATECLVSDGYDRFNKPLLDKPGLMPNENLRSHIITKSSVDVSALKSTNYNYLLSIGPMNRIESAQAARVAKRKKLKKQLKELRSPDIINTTWLREIDAVRAVITKSETPLGWMYTLPDFEFD